jgi:transcription regulator MmyB-like protein
MENRNILWLVFTQSDWRVTIVDWYDVVGRLVAEFRAAMAEHLDDAAYVEGGSSPGCSAPSPELTAFWERHDVQGIESRTKRARHPTVGLLNLDYTNLWVGQQIGTRIVAFTPADERTRERLELLHESLTV